jgi:hypothetical protein
MRVLRKVCVRERGGMASCERRSEALAQQALACVCACPVCTLLRCVPWYALRCAPLCALRCVECTPSVECMGP